jgi:hypothetical protein
MATENVSDTTGTSESGEAGGEITYVGGRAVEQATKGETHEGTDHGDELAAAKAAVKAALEEEGKKAAKEAKEALDKDPVQKAARDANGKFKSDKDPAEREVEEAKEALAKEMKEAEKPAPKPKAKEEDEDASALKKALQERKEVARLKAEAAAEVEKARQEAREFYQRLQREKAALDAEKQRLEMLRKDPIRAIKENGWDPEEFILDIANDGTPEGQQRRAARELQAQVAELAAWKREQAEAAQKQAVQAKEREKAQFRLNVEKQFLAAAAERTPEGTHKHSHIVSMYKDDPAALIVQADLVAERYRAATGQEATFQEIAEYLEERAAKWYKSMSSGSAPQVGAPVTQGKPTPGSATGKRSLSPNGSSERRSLGVNLQDLDGDERRAAAMDAVRAALHASGER